ncbi:hypothetical protein AMATHDRAFT_152123 [Amanita thiersii Skay4041]|uniref:TOG domain-containing protein n=1 Tax=Amanita thiersii Skay4041 TaxID=703135 RepID=A0A2A9NGM3_9AGAR|nr:hypothetical protein AMATHDRAFT_152123 [Amanita thiersii Skay4041]
MSKSQIESWISSTAGAGDDGEDGGAGFSWSRDLATRDWAKALEYAKSVLLIGRTKARVQFLREEVLSLVKNGDLNLSKSLDVFKLLALTYPRYTDAGSREAVEVAGMEMIRRDELRGTPKGAQDEMKLGVAEQIIGWLSVEVGRVTKRGTSSSYAPADLFVLLSWSCGIYAICTQLDPEFPSSTPWRSLVLSMASLLDVILGSEAKSSLKKGALDRTRRALRSVTPTQIAILIETLLAQAKSHPAPLHLIPFIDVAISVLVRLKGTQVPVKERLPTQLKNDILNLYANSVILSRTSIPIHITNSLHDFIATYVTPDDLTKTVLPTIEKALLRSPEYSLPPATSFFTAYAHIFDADTFRRLVTQLVGSSKSNNIAVRSNSVQMFKAIVSKVDSTDAYGLTQIATTELLNLPKTGKSAGPDHRIALYSMLSYIVPTPALSAGLLQTTAPLLAKEAQTQEQATMALASVLAPHVATLLHPGVTESLPPETTALIAKEMNNSKPGIKRAFCTLAGSALFDGDEILTTEKGLAFAKSLLPSFEACLKNISTSALTAAGGPLEGYIAIAVLLGSFARSGKFERDDAISRNVVIQGIISSSVKPSFLLWEKVYQKITDTEDEKWFLRACEVTLQCFKSELAKNEQLRLQLGLALVHLAVDSNSPDTRRTVHTAVAGSTEKLPKLTNDIVREALRIYLSRAATSLKTSASTSEEQADIPVNKQGRFSALLLSAVSFRSDLELDVKEEVLVNYIDLGHHPAVCGELRQTWIDLCQKAGCDPLELTKKRLDALLERILAASTADPKSEFPEASYNAVRTLAFVSPSTVLPIILEQLRADLDPAQVNNLTDMEFGVWRTPDGVTFVDVLSTKAEARQTKGKDAEIAKWEEDLRKSLASKKSSSAVTLTKQQQALVQAQLERESAIRNRVVAIKARFDRGMNFIRSLVSASVDEFKPYISSIAALLVAGALGRGTPLVGQSAFDTYLFLANCISERLDSFRKWIGVATLRCLKLDAVPEELQAEPLNSLIIRVLYRLRSLSEQTPFDGPTFSYGYPLLTQVLNHGGISAADEDEALEQVMLALNIVKFHCNQFSDTTFPRVRVLKDLLHTIRSQSSLSKDASSSLIELGEAISATATRDDIEVLFDGLLMQEPHVRNACLQTLQPFDLTDLDWSPAIWLAYHDEDEQNARLAQHLWEDNGLDVPEVFIDQLLTYLGHENAFVRSSSAAAIGDAVAQWPQTLEMTLGILKEYYRDKAKILAPEYDQYGMVIAQSLDRADPWPARVAIACTLELLAPILTDTEVGPFIEFLVHEKALGDREAEVRRSMLTAGTTVIDLHGPRHLANLIVAFEDHLSRPTSKSETDDQIKEAVVILFGRLARHLNAQDKRLPGIVNRLVEALKTPAEQVQIAVSDCLSPLVKLIPKPRLEKLVADLFEELFDSPKYAARRGAAYGLAGVIKGSGISGMKEFEVMARLKHGMEEKKRFEPKQGVMFAFETLSNTLGRLFEPYITFALPMLLTSFGDSSTDVRETSQDAARVIMGNLSGYGVKLILPTLLEGLDEKQWRSKKGSIELLGMMAYCSPRQLSISLPIIIPRLTGVLTDSHAQVRTAANKSLKMFGEVISNPEIQALVPSLLKALVDPAKTPNALSSLLKTSFMHYIDHSSLALLVPILERGLRERGADTKKKAAQIVGNLASLTDSKDFVPYLSQLLPLVHYVLVDPVPEARATAAKALGTLVERLGEVHFPDLVPGLIRVLKTDTSGVDRQGAAQGLSEVLSGLGMERLEGLLPDIIANAQSPRATIREGFMSLLVYLPATFGMRFQPHLSRIITPILSGLSDTEEYVREAAMRAGRMMVTNYSNKAIDLLLPELERGMFDPGWRIRQSSITLVGELLFKVSGISNKMTEVDEDEEVPAENTAAESSRKALVDALGVERRDRILAALYLVRQDGVSVVRQSSIQIWKVLVSNTPRTVREMLPELMNQIIHLMSSDEPEQQETAGRTVTELCRKFGERTLGEMVTILKTKSSTSDARVREGICLCICDIVISATEGQREDHENEIISMVRVSLVDDEPNVRTAAAKAFDVLQQQMGAKAVDQTIPTLLEALRQPGKGSGTALQALKEVMSVRASTVFPVLIPTLTALPMTVFNARALASLVTVAGNALSRRLNVILGALVKVAEGNNDTELDSAVDEATRALLSSVNDEEGLHALMMLLIGWSNRAKHETPRRRVSACKLFTIFCQVSDLDASLYRVDWIRQLISLLEDTEKPVHDAAWDAFDAFVKSLPKDELEPLVVPLRRSIESTGPPGINVPGFHKGVAPMVPIIIAGLTTGSNEQRENAAYAIGDLVERTEEIAIKPSVVPFTGPLIRVATQATTYPPAVKTAILSALMSMLQRIPTFVKPFFPQLQRTFVKSASDPASGSVRRKAAAALGVLMKNQPRVDPVITELINTAKASEDAVATSLVLALGKVVLNASQNVGDKAKESCAEFVSDAFREDHEGRRCVLLDDLGINITSRVILSVLGLFDVSHGSIP